MRASLYYYIQTIFFTCFVLFTFQSCLVNNLKKMAEMEAVVQTKGNYSKEFPGIQTIVNNNPSQLTNILLIHGVKRTDKNHFSFLKKLLLQELNCNIDSVRNTTIETGQDGKMAGKGVVMIEEYLTKKKDTIRIYNILWSNITLPAKEMVFALDKNQYRTALANTLKNNNLIDVFGDIALYVSPYKEQIYETIQVAIDHMLKKDPFDPYSIDKVTLDETAMITGSFGSKIVFDFLVRELKTKDEASRQLNSIKPEIEKIDLSTSDTSKKNQVKKIFEKEQNKIFENEHNLKQQSLNPTYLQQSFKRVEDNLVSFKYTNAPTTINSQFATVFEEEENRLTKEKKKYYQVAQKLKMVYMLSNQLPFLSGVDLEPEIPATEESFIKSMYENIDDLLKKSEKELNKSTKNPINLQLNLVSFHDPDDVFGYKLPSPPSGSNNLIVTNVELFNTTQWLINPIKLRLNLINNINSPELQGMAKGLLLQDTESQELSFSIQEQNAAAKNNPYLIKHIIHGHNNLQPIDEISLIKKKSKNLTKTKKVKRTIATGAQSYDLIQITKEKRGIGYAIRKAVTDEVISKYQKGIDKIEFTPAWLDYDFPTNKVDFKGIKEAFKKDTIVKVLTIHGMNSKKPENFNTMIYGIAENLRFNLVSIDTLHNMVDTFSSTMAGTPQIRVIHFSNSNNQILKFYDVYWSPITFPTKSILTELDHEKDIHKKRTFLTSTVKSKLVNNGFCGVTLMINQFNESLQNCLDKTFELMISDQDRRENINSKHFNKNTFFISGSLGSKLLYDYVTGRINKEQSTTRAYTNMQISLKKMHTFFMLTNQLPLIAFKDLDPTMEFDSAKYIRHIYGQWDDITTVADSLNIVAFNDPDDILSFLLPKPQSGKIKVKNIQLNQTAALEFNVFHLFKFLTRIDKKLRQLAKPNIRNAKKRIKADYRSLYGPLGNVKEQNITEKDITAILIERIRNEKNIKKEFKRKQIALLKQIKEDIKTRHSSYALSILKNAQNIIETDKPRQQLVYRFDLAHENPSEDDRVIHMLTFGTKNIKRVDPTIERKRYKSTN